MHPFFLDRGGQRLFAIHHPPPAGTDHRGDLLFVPPFAEEMNRSRRMMTLLAQAAGRVGYGCLIVDLIGTGDSDGEFVEARWEDWRADMLAAAAWLQTQWGKPVTLVGLRLGAILALETAAAMSPAPARIVLWQPVGGGEVYLNQFLRIRLAAQLTGGDGSETTKSLREQFAAGEAVEVAGYDIPPALASTMDTLRLAPLGPDAVAPIDWLELVAAEDRPIPPASQRILDEWQQANVAVAARTVTGEPFWTLLETATAPNLIDATAEILRGDG